MSPCVFNSGNPSEAKQVTPSLVMAGTDCMINPEIFEHLQTKLDEDAQVREELRNIVQSMERQGSVTHIFSPTYSLLMVIFPDKTTMSILSRAHSIPQAERAYTRRCFAK